MDGKPRVSSAPTDHEKNMELDNDVRKNLNRPRTCSAPLYCGSSNKLKRSGNVSHTTYKDGVISCDLYNRKEGNATKRYMVEGQRYIIPAVPKLPLFPDSRTLTPVPPKEQNQDEPSYFPTEMLEKKHVNFPIFQGCHTLSNIPKHSETISMSEIQFFYYKAKYFQHFDYIYKLTRECKLRNFGEKRYSCSCIETTPMPKDVILKIGIFGVFNEDNLKLISTKKGQRIPSKDQTVWKVTPILCFQNDFDLKSAVESLLGQGAFDKILIKSSSTYNETVEITGPLIVVDENKEDIIRAITYCLEKPIHQMLQNWSTYLKTEGLGKHTSRATAEMKAIRKQLVLDESKRKTPAFDIPRFKCKSIVPGDIRDYLFGRLDVNAFGIWSNSSFKLFVNKTTDERGLKSELMKRYRHFFDKYPLDVEIGTFKEHPILKQGDSIFAGNDCNNSLTGTIGGIVTKVDEERKTYALTCHHIFPSRDQFAYADGSNDGVRKQIGSCVFTTSDMSCDFAAIEINDRCFDNCNVTFRRDDGKDINAHLYSDNLENVGIVHKIGATTGVTQGYILSPEFYNRVEGNRERIFLVKGTDRTFSEDGDSGSLVFSRPRSVQQNYVDIVGMVYAKNRREKDEIEIYNRTDKESEVLHGDHNFGKDVKNADENNQQNLTPSLSKEDDGQKVAKKDQDAEEFSFCYRLHTAIELFEGDQGPGFEVRFKDNLSSSSLSTSPSSESDVETV